ncbi:MAG TPA: hypothetical protein DCP51_01780 [Clostridiales bacterium]|nr:hypothetical protein [Clostridiales bacterium]
MDLFGIRANRENEQLKIQLNQAQTDACNFNVQLIESKKSIQELSKKLEDLGYTEYSQVMAVVEEKNSEIIQDN